MTEERKKLLDELMRKLPKEWRFNWCEAKMCACRGCAKLRLLYHDFTKEDWRNWLSEDTKKYL